MTVKELVEKLNPQTRENLWYIFVDNNEYIFETDLEARSKEVKSWDLEYGLEGYHFRLTLRIYTVDYKEEE